MRKVYPVIFLLALALSLIAFAGIVWGQSDLKYQTCPSDISISSDPVPIDIAVDVVFNQDIELLTTDGITITADEAGQITVNPRVSFRVDNMISPGYNYVLWLLDPWFFDPLNPDSNDNLLPAGDKVHVHIPKSCVATKDGGQRLSQDIDFSFKTGDNENHYLFNFVTPVTTQPTHQPKIHITKAADPSSLPDGPGKVTYTYTVTNTGNVPLSDVSVVDDKLGAVTNLVYGDTDSDDLLDPGEIWVYTARADLSETTTNTATATGYYGDERVTDQATATVEVTSNPGGGETKATLHVVKHVINTHGGKKKAYDFTLYVRNSDGKVVKEGQGAEAPGTAYTLDAGTYTVSEGEHKGYTASFSGFKTSDGSSGTITLAAGDDKTVTITNKDRSSSSDGDSGNPPPKPGEENPPPVPAPPSPNETTSPGPNAAPPPETAPAPKLPKTGVDSGGENVPWQVPVGIMVIASLLLNIVQRKRSL